MPRLKLVFHPETITAKLRDYSLNLLYIFAATSIGLDSLFQQIGAIHHPFAFVILLTVVEY